MARPPKFQPVIRRARVSVPGFSADTMLRFAGILNSSIQTRLDRALDIYDSAAPPLSARYGASKLKRYGVSLRDWRFTGRTRRAMRPLSAQQNKAVIGFSDPGVSVRVKKNQQRSRQYGVSPLNREDIYNAIRQSLERPVTIVREAS